MPRFFLNIRNGLGFTRDEEGQVLSSREAARDEALKGARSLLSAEVLAGELDLRGSIEVTDEAGEGIVTVPFREAVRIRDGEPPEAEGQTGDE